MPDLERIFDVILLLLLLLLLLLILILILILLLLLHLDLGRAGDADEFILIQRIIFPRGGAGLSGPGT